MSIDALLTLAIMVVATLLFVSEKLPVDVVALLVLASLLVSGLLTPAEALSGFSSEATITVAAMFVLSAGLQHTGALRWIGHLFSRVRRPWLLLLLMLAVVGPVSAFINNTAAVAVFLPLVLTASAASRQSSSQLLMPLSYAAQMGGVCTLIGTSTNLLVDSLAKDLGHPGFGLFDITGLGLCLMAAGFIYILLFQRWLLPHHPPEPIADAYGLGKYVSELRVGKDSPLIGRVLDKVRFDGKHDVHVLELLRGQERIAAARTEKLAQHDVLLVHGDWNRIAALRERFKLEIEPSFKLQDGPVGTGEAQAVAEVMIAPGSRLIGHNLSSAQFQWNYKSTVLAIHRRGEVLRDQLKNVGLAMGDILLLLAPQAEMDNLRRNSDLVVLSEREQPAAASRKWMIAVAIMIATILVAALGWLPIVASSILGCIALIATRCIGNDEAYQAVDWRVIVLLAGVLPLGIAMQKSGLAQAGASAAIHLVGGFGPLAVLAAIYFITALLTEMMSNNAAAVLIAPIAYATALSLQVSPTPFLIAVMFAASTSFSTPVGYQTNTMVYNAGNYRFIDFMRFGIPLNLLFWALSVWLIPKFFPFQ